MRTLTAEVERFAGARAGRPWALAWCAGAGVVATGEEALATEVRVFERVTAALAASVTPDDAGVVFLASSAGGLYAGSTPAPFDERTAPRPLVAYGRAKLAMESAVERLAADTGLRAVLGRLSNVYGPGPDPRQAPGPALAAVPRRRDRPAAAGVRLDGHHPRLPVCR